MRETGPSKRTIRTATHTNVDGKDRLRSVRETANLTPATHTINGEMDWCLIRNDGDNDIKINFKTDNMSNNYWTLKPGQSLPAAIGVFKGTTIHYKSVGGQSQLELILWA